MNEARIVALERVAESLRALLEAFIDRRPTNPDDWVTYDSKDAGIVELLELEGRWYWEEELRLAKAALAALDAIGRGR